MILLLNRYGHEPIITKFLFMAVSMCGVASSIGGLVFDYHHVFVNLFKLLRLFACAVAFRGSGVAEGYSSS